MEQWEINLREELAHVLHPDNIETEIEKERFIRSRIAAAKEYLTYIPNDNFLETFLKYA